MCCSQLNLTPPLNFFLCVLLLRIPECRKKKKPSSPAAAAAAACYLCDTAAKPPFLFQSYYYHYIRTMRSSTGCPIVSVSTYFASTAKVATLCEYGSCGMTSEQESIRQHIISQHSGTYHLQAAAAAVSGLRVPQPLFLALSHTLTHKPRPCVC